MSLVNRALLPAMLHLQAHRCESGIRDLVHRMAFKAVDIHFHLVSVAVLYDWIKPRNRRLVRLRIHLLPTHMHIGIAKRVRTHKWWRVSHKRCLELVLDLRSPTEELTAVLHAASVWT